MSYTIHMATDEFSSQQADVLRKVNAIAATTNLDMLLRHTFELVLEVTHSSYGNLLLSDCLGGDVNDYMVIGEKPVENESCSQMVVFIVENEVVCQIELGNPDRFPQRQIDLITSRLASEIKKARLLTNAMEREARLLKLVEFISRISASLDVEEILAMIIQQARELLGTEAASLFIVEESTGDLVLKLASNADNNFDFSQVRVPRGKGIIGQVVSNGKPTIVQDVRREKSHFQEIDLQTGFTTRSILAIPMTTREVYLGDERGISSARIIGGVEAVNKIDGIFVPSDVEMLTALTNQAATFLEVARLYRDANELFLDVLRALTAAIDAKDPYTKGHSRRVCEFSVAIARELGLSADQTFQIKVGSLFHDVGKLGVPDAILQKPNHLTKEEFAIIQQHPNIGAHIMRQIQLLNNDLLQMAEQHHERLDGSGYPCRLSGDDVSLPGRIAAVADVFDAITSRRAYREAMSAMDAIDYLESHSSTKFDRDCVAALAIAHQKGWLIVQKDRQESDFEPLLPSSGF